MKKFDNLLKKGWVMLPIAICFVFAMLDQFIDMPILYEIMKWSGITFLVLGVYIVGKTWYLYISGKG